MSAHTPQVRCFTLENLSEKVVHLLSVRYSKQLFKSFPSLAVSVVNEESDAMTPKPSVPNVLAVSLQSALPSQFCAESD